MKQEWTFLSADGKTDIHAVEWIPENGVCAVLQISHGMVEYIERYDRFAEYMNEHGILVVGNDHLGHGQSVVSDEMHGFFARPDGNGCVISDLHTLRSLTEKKYPGKPYFLLGHSMGSFLARQYMMMHGKGLQGVIVMGTGCQSAATLAAGRLICHTMALFKGWQYRSTLVNNLAFSGNNKAFEPSRTRADWLTRDEKTVDAYCADPWCSFIFTLNGFDQMLRGMQYMQTGKHLALAPKKCPVLFVSGENDPVGNFGKSVKQVCEQYRQAGFEKVSIKLYPEDRHEILNELDRDAVYQDLKKWIMENI